MPDCNAVSLLMVRLLRSDAVGLRQFVKWWDAQRTARCRGWCTTHYGRWLRSGDPLVRLQCRRAEGRKYSKKDGYVSVFDEAAGKRRPEHRVIMEQFLGRKLLAHEDVHHKNGVRHDNRLENLELWSHSQPRGQRVEDKLAWCREFQVQYTEFVVGIDLCFVG